MVRPRSIFLYATEDESRKATSQIPAFAGTGLKAEGYVTVNASKLCGIPYDYGNLSLQTHQKCVIPAKAGIQDDAYIHSARYNICQKLPRFPQQQGMTPGGNLSSFSLNRRTLTFRCVYREGTLRNSGDACIV